MSNITPYNQQGIESIIAGMTPHERAICDVLNTFNQLRSFKLEPMEIIYWKDSIVKLIPDVDTGALEFVVDQMIVGGLEYDTKLGIQNIFNGLKRVRKTETGYAVKTNQTW